MILSGYAKDELVNAALDRGDIDRFVSKKESEEEILQTIRSLLQES